MIPQRFAHILFGFILTGLMSLLVSGITTLRMAGISDGFLAAWVASWLPSWLVAFPVVLFVAPLARRLVALLTAPEQDRGQE